MISPGESAYRRTELDVGREVAFLARALELAASRVERPISAVAALQVARAERRELAEPHPPRPWFDAVRSAARALGMQPHLRVAAARELLEGQVGPALGQGMHGEWLLVVGRRGRRLRVTLIDEHGDRTRTMSTVALDRITGGEVPWVGLEPLLALEPIAHQPGEPWRPWSRLRELLRLERRELWVVVVYAIVIGAMTLATPIAVQAVVNTIAFGAVLQPLVVLSALLLAGLSFSGLLQVLEAFVVEVLQRRIFVRVAEDFGRRLPAVDPLVHDRRHVPELVNRFFEVITIQKAFAVLLLDGLSLTLQMAIGLLLLSFYHPLLLAFGAVLVSLLGVVILMGRGATKSALLECRAKYATAAWLEDIARAPALFRGARGSEHAAQRTEMLCRDYLSARRRHYRILLRQIAGGLGLQVFAMVSLLGVGGWLVIERQLTLGQLVAAELVIGAVAAGFSKLGKNLEKAYDLVIGVEKLGAVVDLPAERRGGEVPETVGPVRLGLREVTVQRGSRVLLSSVDLDVGPSDRIAVRGDTAVGKSTLLDTLGGARPATHGAVVHDNVDLRRADLGLVRDQVVIVRGVELVAGSILDNLGLGAGALTGGRARELLALVELEEAIDGLPQGLDTPMLPAGAPLSSSQARRLALARALASRPRGLLLDGALDDLGLPPPRFESLLELVLGPGAPWSAVVVTHDPRVAAWCNRVIRIEDRALVEVQ